MKRTHAISRVLIVVLFLFVIAIPFSVQAQDEGFTETFDDPSLNGWERSEQAVVKDGSLVISQGHFAAKFGEYGSGTYEFKAKFAGPGVMFFRFAMREEGNYAVVFVEDRIALEKVTEKPQELAAMDGVEYSSDWMNVKVLLDAGELEIFLDDVSILTATDPEPLEGGGLGFWVEGETAAEFDDLSFSSSIEGPSGGSAVGEEELPETTVSPPADESVSSGSVDIADFV